MPSPTHALAASLDPLLLSPDGPDWPAILALVLQHFACPVGTVHLLHADDNLLHLAAARGIPPVVMDKVQRIPIGKGMAGIAAERREPVQVCNLQQDDSGVVRPGARLTQMEGSLAVPMLAGGSLFGVLGVAKPEVYEFSAAESALLLAIGAQLATRLAEDR